MSVQKYLLVFRHDASAAEMPSPSEMQTILAAWMAWRDQFQSETVNMGDGLKPNGTVVRPTSTTDGPYIEAKEVIGGFSFIETESLERAVEISKACPALMMPGASVEIREQVGY